MLELHWGGDRLRRVVKAALMAPARACLFFCPTAACYITAPRVTPSAGACSQTDDQTVSVRICAIPGKAHMWHLSCVRPHTHESGRAGQLAGHVPCPQVCVCCQPCFSRFLLNLCAASSILLSLFIWLWCLPGAGGCDPRKGKSPPLPSVQLPLACSSPLMSACSPHTWPRLSSPAVPRTSSCLLLLLLAMLPQEASASLPRCTSRR